MSDNKPPISERRPARRARVILGGLVVSEDGAHSFRCSIRDLSETGARISILPNTLIPKSLFLINIRDRTAHHAERIWSNGKVAGLMFNRTVALDRLDDPKLAFLKRLLDAISER